MDRQAKGGVSRREFLKSTVVGAAALGLGPTILIPRRAEALAPGGAVHPNISPLRVVGVHDPKMTTDAMEHSTWKQQEQLLRPEVVAENLDRMACALTQERDPARAWRTIFLKPPGKAWTDTVVAIKVNCISKQRTRSAVLYHIIRVLTDVLGAKGGNIFVYDACHGGSMAKWDVARNLPNGAQAVARWGGSTVPVPVGKPWKDGSQKAKCLAQLAKGEVDILVDIALCKGHSQTFGGFTMSMKNHFGTFDPGPSHQSGGGADYLIAINQTPQILGAMDPKTGKVLFPRQQLCLIDCLWASEPGPGGDSTAQPNRLFMGTLPAVLDYQVATRFRRDVMGWKVNDRVVSRFLSDFGYQPSDLPAGGQIIDALAG